MRALGPRQRDLLDHIRRNGGKVTVIRGLYPIYYVTLSDPGRLVTADRVLSLVDRGLLRRVEVDGYDFHYEIADDRRTEGD